MLQLRITAYHEAAHAVMAFRLGMRVDELRIDRAGSLGGYVKFRGPVSPATVADPSAPVPPWPTVLRDTERQVMVFLAGPLAEAKLLGSVLRSHSCESDLGRAEVLCRAASTYRDYLVRANGRSLPPIDAAAMANELRRRTARLLARPNVWHAVAVLAADLEGWGSLSGYDAADTLQWARRVRHQLALLLPVPNLRRRPAPAPDPMGPSADSRLRRSSPKSLHGGNRVDGFPETRSLRRHRRHRQSADGATSPRPLDQVAFATPSRAD